MIRTAPTSLKIRQILTDVQNKTLLPRPEFQRRLVWSMTDKVNFIDTILSGFPFPEIYIADSEVDLETGKGTQLLVDGQQRVTSMFEYFSGSPLLKLSKGLLPYQELTDDQKKSFLNYDVAVRNLGIVSQKQIIEIFRRINSTNYSLNDMEINNAMYAGRFKTFCEELTNLPFFEAHSFFRPMQLRRMGDVKYIASILITMIGGYFNRDDLLEEYLQRYNDEFPEEQVLRTRFMNVLTNIKSLELDNKSRAWKQADFFTLACELDDFLFNKKLKLKIPDTKRKLELFYKRVDSTFADERTMAYQSATIQAANDKSNRITRGKLIRPQLISVPA